MDFWLIYKQDTQYRTNVRICSILEIVEMIAGGQLKVKDMVTHTFTLNEVNLAFETFEKRIGGAMKVIIYPNK